MPIVPEKVLAVDLESLQYKPLLTVSEAAALTGVGQNKIDKMLKEADCEFVLHNGKKKMIKKDAFIKYLLTQNRI